MAARRTLESARPTATYHGYHDDPVVTSADHDSPMPFGHTCSHVIASIRVRHAGLNDALGYPVCRGVPVARGVFTHPFELCLRRGTELLRHQVTPLAYWDDGSVRWLLVECLLDVPAQRETVLELIRGDATVAAAGTPHETSTPERGHAALSAHCRDGSPVPALVFDARSLYPFADMDVRLCGAGGECLAFRHDGRGVRTTRGAVRSTFRCAGEFVDAQGRTVVRVECRLDVIGMPSRATLELLVHNPHAARHAGGFWDLGDAGSTVFAGLSIVIGRRENDSVTWRLERGRAWEQVGRQHFVLSQTSSGGSLPDSPNHMNSAGEIPATEAGYRLELDGRTVERGSRCSPDVRVEHERAVCQFHLRHFWQNFPKRIEADAERLMIGLFPENGVDLFELQGGEKKTHTLDVILDGRDPRWVDADVGCHVDLASWRAANALPYLAADRADAEMDAIIEEGLTGENNFFVKRERIDEYGWRHFGDVHADHETWLPGTPQPLSSHYNNQYDLLYGFIRLSVLSERAEWQWLANDLARHVLDIDLYDTRDDRPEYNGGLFWHTDHYLPALTSTHRTYSRGHANDSAKAVGGGPGGEHCYTTGLKLYHFTTGCQRARSAVVVLADWVATYYEGSGTLLETSYRALRNGTAAFVAVLRGEAISRHVHPPHRGIGNLVTSQLDAFEITGRRAYLDRAERIVLSSIGPHDDPATRGLGDVERHWSYAIFLQGLIRYLDVKRTLDEFDPAFFYARDSLSHYADWMLEHEAPYLHDADALEYPNHTWAAQDIRRCAIFLDAYRYGARERADWLEASRNFARYVVDALRDEPTRSYTRILAILMQNHGASALARSEPARHVLPSPRPYVAELHVRHTGASVLALHAAAVLRALRGLSPQAELHWLRGRLRR